MYIIYNKMQKFILNSLNELKDILNKDERNTNLQESEKIMMEDIDVIYLSNRLKASEDNYSFVLSYYKDNTDKIEEAKNNLYQSKLELDQNEKVRNYTKDYIKVRDLYNEIDDIMFSKYRTNPLKFMRGKYDKNNIR